ncbi:MAG: DNA repair protein RadC [Alphaproteobacteria bacterium]|nr:DNA repair protein RadC [Alphaproteobacteria bacterium]
MEKPEKPHHLEHRKRLRTRFLKDLGAHMEDYELLELLLCQTIPRRDVKPLAKSLITKFGSFGGVLSADAAQLAAEPGLGETSVVGLKVIQQAAIRLLRQEIEGAHVLSSWQAVVDYCRAAMGREKIEQFRLLFLDNRNCLIADEVQQRGTVNHTPLYPREVLKRALELGASALIMVHNHPSGDPTPSKADIEMTRYVRDALSKVDIRLHDHIIVAKSEFRSLKTDGYI